MVILLPLIPKNLASQRMLLKKKNEKERRKNEGDMCQKITYVCIPQGLLLTNLRQLLLTT